MKLLVAVTVLVLMSGTTHAQIFNLTRITDSGATINALIDAEIQEVENEINADIPAGDPKRLMEGMANSQAAAGKGLGTDYISHFETFMVGAGFGAAADLEENKQYDSDLSGAGVQGGIMVGLHMSAFTDGGDILWMDARRLSLVLNAFTLDFDRKADDNNINAELYSFGFMGTYKWYEGDKSRWFGWDGLRVHMGYQYSSTKLKFSTTINETISETTGTGETITGTVTGRPGAEITSTVHSIPLEISSGVNFLYIMSFYGGLGTDFNVGQARGKGNDNVEDSTITCSGGVACGGNPTSTIRAEANVDEKARVMPFFLRAFAGFQFNLPYFNVFVQGNKVFGTEVYSAATGVRLVF